MSENQAQEAESSEVTPYRARFTVDGPDGGRQIEIVVKAPSEALALGIAQNAMLGLAASPPPPPSRSGLQDYLSAIGEGLGRVMVQSGVFMHVYDRPPSGEPDAEFDDEPTDCDPEEPSP
jgi:hypothetical protein